MDIINKLKKDLTKMANDFQNQIDHVGSQAFNNETDLKNLESKLSACKLKMITGVAYHGQTLPVPNGSLRSNCIYIVSLNRWTNTHSDNKYTYDMYISVNQSTGLLTCYTKTSGRNGSGGTYSGYANYITIDVSSISI